MNKASYYQTLMQEVDNLDNPKDKIELLKLRLLEYKLMTPLEKMKYKDWVFLKDGDYIATQIEFYEDKLKAESKPARQGRVTSYTWTGTPEQVDKLYTELTKTPNPIIKCTPESFKKAFDGGLIGLTCTSGLEIKMS